MLDNLWEALEIYKEGKALCPGLQLYRVGFRAIKEQWYSKQSLMRRSGLPKAEVNKRLVRGEAGFRPYPFMSIEYLQRSEALVTRIQQNFKRVHPEDASLPAPFRAPRSLKFLVLLQVRILKPGLDFMMSARYS